MRLPIDLVCVTEHDLASGIWNDIVSSMEATISSDTGPIECNIAVPVRRPVAHLNLRLYDVFQSLTEVGDVEM